MADTLFMSAAARARILRDGFRLGSPPPSATPPAFPPAGSRVVWWVLTALFVGGALFWTVRSSRALSHTFDEPHHLVTGLEWLQLGTYRAWTENPPLPKIAVALGPYLAGLRLPARAAEAPKQDPWDLGIDLLYDGGQYDRWVSLARLGTLPFLLLTLVMTFLLAGGGKRLFAAFVATALVATYPPLLGHAGLATTDVAAVSTTLLFLHALDRWWSRRTMARAAWVGVAFGLALLCKLTAPLLALAIGVGWLVGRRLAGARAAEPAAGVVVVVGTPPARGGRRKQLPAATPRKVAAPGGSGRGAAAIAVAGVVACLAAFVVVWAGYRFSIGRIDDLPLAGYIRPLLPPVSSRPEWLAWLCRLPIPAPEVPHGFLFLKSHHDEGHLAYLFGKIDDHGFWNFYLVGLLLKSPLTFLALAVVTALILVRLAGRGRIAAVGPAAGLALVATLALSTINTVNIGLRHLLVAVPLAAIWMAVALDALVGNVPARGVRRLAVAALLLTLAGQAAIVERAQPELMAYFNPLAGREPGEALMDSDLDWGQDFLLLKRELAARQISSVRLAFFGTVRPCGPDMPKLLPLVPRQPATGWIVISENYYRAPDLIGLRRDPCDPTTYYGFHEAPSDGFAWLRAHTPVARVGASLRIYNITRADASD